MYADIGMTRPRCGNAGVGVFAPWQRWPSDGVCDPTLSVDKAVFVFRDGDVFHMYDLGSVWRPVWVKIHDRKCYRSFHHPSLIATRITCVPNNQPSQAKTAEVDRRRLVCTGVLIICLYLRRWLKGEFHPMNLLMFCWANAKALKEAVTKIRKRIFHHQTVHVRFAILNYITSSEIAWEVMTQFPPSCWCRCAIDLGKYGYTIPYYIHV